jgi:hypothetical protein
MIAAQLQRCPENVKQLGARLLSYLLAISEVDARSLVESGAALDSARVSALDLLSSAVRDVRSWRSNDHLLQDMDWWRFQDLKTADGKRLLVQVRNAFATSAIETTVDPVSACLREMAVETFPYLLLPSPNGVWANDPGFTLPHFFNEPVAKRFREAVRADPDLRRLFPETRAGDDAGGLVVGADFAGTLQLWAFEDTILRTAFCWMHLEDQRTLAAMAIAIDRVLRTLRSLARGEICKIPTLICFNGVGLPEGTRAETLVGELREFSGGVSEIVPRVVRPPIGGPRGAHLGFVAVTDLDVRIRVLMPQEFDKVRLVPTESPLKRNIDSISLAVPLAAQRAEPVAVVHTTTLSLNPFRRGSFGWKIRQGTSWAPVELTMDEAKDLRQWCDDIHGANDSRARTAVQRAVRALSERDDAVDSFIDAIIAFESLFGERQQVALSLATCVARLLEGNPSGRRKTYDRMKKLYDQRSSVLHGGSQPSQAQMMEHRDDALRYLVACFRVLYRQRPELLAMRASERDIELLLGQ